MRELRRVLKLTHKLAWPEFVLLLSTFPNWKSITVPLHLVSSEVHTALGWVQDLVCQKPLWPRRRVSRRHSERGSAGATKPPHCPESDSWEPFCFLFFLSSCFLMACLLETKCPDLALTSSIGKEPCSSRIEVCPLPIPTASLFPIRKAVAHPNWSSKWDNKCSWLSPCEKHACIQRKEKAGGPRWALCMIVFLPQLCFWTALPVFCYRIVLQEPIISAKIPQVGVPVWPANQSDCGLQWKNWIILTIPAPR